MFWRLLFVIGALTFALNGAQVLGKPAECSVVSLGHEGSARYGSVTYSCWTNEEVDVAAAEGIDLGFTMPGSLAGLLSLSLGLVGLGIGTWPLPAVLWRRWPGAPKVPTGSGGTRAETTGSVQREAKSRGEGDVLLAAAARGDEHAAQKVASYRAEGATDADIRHWWNLTRDERIAVQEDDERARLASYIQNLERLGDPEKAAGRVFKFHPRYGDSDDATEADAHDRALPIVLKDRVNRYVESRMADGNAFLKELEASTTFNAHVRRKLGIGGRENNQAEARRFHCPDCGKTYRSFRTEAEWYATHRQEFCTTRTP